MLAAVSAQERYVKPSDEGARDKSFAAFRTRLTTAAKKRDAKYVLSVVDRNIKVGFGEKNGIEEFKRLWKLNDSKSKFWDEFLPVISNGGKFDQANRNLFFAPYVFSSFPDDVDAFNHSVVFGNNVSLRSQPAADSAVVAVLSYNIVELLDSVKEKNDINKTAWYEVQTLGGKRGFVSAEYVRSPIDYRAGFEKIRGKWVVTLFVAGD